MHPIPERIGSYKIQRLLGQGGFGVVYEGFDEQSGRRAALKILLSDKATDKETVARFIREANALLTFENHRGIVRAYHAEKTSNGLPYLAMEFLEGKTLREWMRGQTDSIPLLQVSTIAEQIAATMVDVHDRRFIHRDLKPENIMMVPDEHSLLGVRPVLLDFGVVKLSVQTPFDDQAMTQIKTDGLGVIGTPAYMAPEQIWDADNVDMPADVYTLGLVVYELLAGELPFGSKGTMERTQMRERGELIHLRAVEPSAPPLFASFVMAMLARNPKERPSMRDCQRMFAREWTPNSDECPFPGFLPFDDLHRHLFLGRHEETEFIKTRLAEIHAGSEYRWLQIEGSAGVGKSSFLCAAVLPALRLSEEWFVSSMLPSKEPIRGLASVFARAYDQNEEELFLALDTNSEALDTFLHKRHQSSAKVLLVIDAFEDVLVLPESDRKKFEKLLAHALKNADSPLRLLTVIRSEERPRLDNTPLHEVRALHYELSALDDGALLAVVDGMTLRAGLRLENGLSQKIVHDAPVHAYRTSLVGNVLRHLWSLQNRETITRDDYENMCGVGGALTDDATKVLDALAAEELEKAKWMILDLVELGSGAPDTRRLRLRADVLRAAGEGDFAEGAFQLLSRERTAAKNANGLPLLVVSGASVELVHEMVVRKVPRIVEWIRAERPFLELLASLERAALEWRRKDVGKPKGGLPTGTLLAHYRGGKDPEQQRRLWRMVSAEVREYLQAAMDLERRERQRWIGFGAVIVAAVVVIAVSAVVALRARARAEKNLEATLETTDNIINDVDWRMGRIGYTLPLRRKILLPQHEQLLNLENDEPDSVRIRLIDSLQRLSDLERLHGTVSQAEVYVDAAEKRIEAGLKSIPGDVELKTLWALNLSKRGKLHLLRGHNTDALRDFDDSIDDLEALRGQSAVADEQTLATSHIEKGDALKALDQFALAGKSYSTGVAIRRRLAAELKDPQLPYRRALLAESLVLRALVMPDQDQAMNDLLEAQAIAKSLADEEEQNLLYQSIYGMTFLGIAAIHKAAQRWPDARTAHERAGVIGAILHKSAPEQKEYMLLFIEALDGLQLAANKTGDWALEKESRSRCLELRRAFVLQDSLDLRITPFKCALP